MKKIEKNKITEACCKASSWSSFAPACPEKSYYKEIEFLL